MSINSPKSFVTWENFFKEEVIPQKFNITINPQKVPLINGINEFKDKNNQVREMTAETKVYSFGDKVVIQQDGVFFTNTDGSDTFECITDKWGKDAAGVWRDNWGFNKNTFEESGDSIVSRLIEFPDKESEYECMINGKKYTIPQKSTWSLSSGLMKCIWNKIYVNWGQRMQIFNAVQWKLIPVSEEKSEDNLYMKMLPNGDLVKFTKDSKSKKVQINNKKWVNAIEDFNIQTQNNEHHFWIWNPKELVIDDKKYDLTGKKWAISNHCQVSEDGNVVAIDFDYNEEWGYWVDYTKLKRGKYMLLGDRNGIQKEIKLGEEWINKIAVDDQWQLAYITKQRTGGQMLLHIHEFQYELDLKDDNNAIKKFSFIGKNTINIEYINLQNELVEKNISLNEDAEQVKQKLEAQEQEVQKLKAMQEWLQKNNITSVEQLQKMMVSAQQYDGLQTKIQDTQGQNTKLEMWIGDLKKEKEQLEIDKTTLQGQNTTLAKSIETIKWWTKPWSFGYYKISDVAKKELWLK